MSLDKMSLDNLNTILKSYVREQAYFPFKSPVSAWVCKVRSKGLSASLLSVSEYCFLSCGFFRANFFAFFRYAGEYSIVRFIKDCLYRIFNRFEANRRFLFRRQNPINKSLAFLLFLKKIPDKISRLVQVRLGKHRKHFFDVLNLIYSGFHCHIITQKSGQQNNRQTSLFPYRRYLECNSDLTYGAGIR